MDLVAVVRIEFGEASKSRVCGKGDKLDFWQGP